MFDSCNFLPENTGLSVCVYVRTKSFGVEPSIIVCEQLDYFPCKNFLVQFSKDIKPVGSVFVDDIELHKIKTFVKLNQKLFLQYWHYKIDAVQLVKGLKSLKETI